LRGGVVHAVKAIGDSVFVAGVDVDVVFFHSFVFLMLCYDVYLLI
jgi:quercetin dioxygenase-like cupin family protein